jgi:hypothetical protein
MFKNYLTYNLALSFHRSCMSLEVSIPTIKERLMRSSETMIHHFARSIHAPSTPEGEKARGKDYFVAMQCLQDCHETLKEAEVEDSELGKQYEVLYGRLEQLCLDAASEKNGQIRMLV